MNEKRIAKLATLGLTTYEARVYLALLELGQAPARRLAEASGVPQTRLYETCRSLHERGLVEETLHKPKEYQPIPISHFLHTVCRDHERRARSLEQERETWEEEFGITGRGVQGTRGSFLTYHGRRRVLGRSRELFEHARDTVLVRASDRTLARLRALVSESPHPERLDVRVAHHVTTETLPFAEALAPLAQVRHAREPNPISFVTVDGREAMLYHWAHREGGDDAQAGDVALWTDDPDLVAGFEQSILDTWNLSLPLEERAREIRTGAPPRFTRMLQGHYSGKQVVDLLVPQVSAGAQLIVSEGGLRRLSQSEAFLTLLESATLCILAPVTARNRDAAERLSEHAQVRHLPFWFGQNHVIVDDAQAFVTTYMREGPTLETTDLLNAVHSTEPGMVQAERQLFEGLWGIGVPLPQRFAELDKAGDFLRSTRDAAETRAWVQGALTNARDEVSFMTTENGLDRVRVYDYGPAIARGARLRVVAPVTEANRALAERMAERWEVRHHPGVTQGQFIIDRREVITAYLTHDTPDLEDAGFFCVGTNAAPAVRMALTLFDAVWEAATPLEELPAEGGVDGDAKARQVA